MYIKPFFPKNLYITIPIILLAEVCNKSASATYSAKTIFSYLGKC